MRFVYPQVLWALLLLPIMSVGYVLVQLRINRLLDHAGDAVMIGRMIAGRDRVKRTLRYVLMLLVLFFLIIGISRPQYGLKHVPVTRKGIDVVVAMDTSKSMLAEDIKPSRLEKAKHELRSFISKLKGDRTGIVLFAGKAFIQCPLTIDYDAVALFGDSIDVNSVPAPGTDISEAIKTSLLVFDNKERKYKVLLLITDGEGHDPDAMAQARKAADAGIVIYTVGIGSSTGEPIPVFDSNGNRVGYKTDRDGKMVVSKLNEDLLKTIATATGGAYYHATPAEFELDTIYKEIRNMGQKDIHSRLIQQYEDRFQYPLVAALIMLMLQWLIPEKRRRHE